MSPPTRHEKSFYNIFFSAAVLRFAALAPGRKCVCVLHSQARENIEKTACPVRYRHKKTDIQKLNVCFSLNLKFQAILTAFWALHPPTRPAIPLRWLSRLCQSQHL